MCMRQWNTRELNDGEQELIRVWLELVDEEGTYYSPREHLVETLNQLVLSTVTGNYGEFTQAFDRAESKCDSISNKELRGAVENIRRAIPDIESSQDKRREVNDELRQAIDIKEEKIFDIDYFIDIENLRSRIYSQIAAQADSEAFQAVDSDRVREDFNTILFDLRSDMVRRRYNTDMVRDLEDFLTGE